MTEAEGLNSYSERDHPHPTDKRSVLCSKPATSQLSRDGLGPQVGVDGFAADIELLGQRAFDTPAAARARNKPACSSARDCYCYGEPQTSGRGCRFSDRAARVGT